MSKNSILGLEPKAVMKNFYEISQIPRGSREEEKIATYLEDFFKKHGAKVYRDKSNNIIAKKPGTPGLEKKPIVVLQGHMDMVNVKDHDSKHDFSKDPINVFEEGGFLKADKTSLGADNGIGVAMIMSVFADEIPHCPVTAVITSDEESGMFGAIALDVNKIEGDYFLNLDGEVDNSAFLGCLGIRKLASNIKIKRELLPANHSTATLSLKNLKSGHSGLEIHLKRINAIKECFSLFYRLNEKFDIRIISVNGGEKPNVIPASCDIEFSYDTKSFKDIEKFINEYQTALRLDYHEEESKLFFELKKAAVKEKPLIKADSTRLILFMNTIFNGTFFYNFKEELPESSSNIGIMKTNGDLIKVNICTRGLTELELERTTNAIAAANRLANFEWEMIPESPALMPSLVETKFVKMFKKIYLDLFKTPIKTAITGGGLETTIFAKCKPNLVTIAYGPNIFSPHSTKETIEVASISKVWKFLGQILTKIE